MLKLKGLKKIHPYVIWGWHELSADAPMPITLRLKKLPKGDEDDGDCVMIDDDSVQIRLHRDVIAGIKMLEHDSLWTLFHELVHAHQFVRGDLTHDHRGRMLWCDQPVPGYWDSPHEIEAYGRGYCLAMKFAETFIH